MPKKRIVGRYRTPPCDKGNCITLEVEDLDGEVGGLGLYENCDSLFEGFIGNGTILSRFERYRRIVADMRYYGIDPPSSFFIYIYFQRFIEDRKDYNGL